MAGMNRTAWLAERGMGAGKVDVPKVFIDNLYLHPVGHPLRHPRADDPFDEEIVADIMQRGIVEPVVVRIEHAKRGEVLALCDGAQRKINGREAERRLRAAGDRRLLKEDSNGNWSLPVKVEFITCDDKAFLLERQKRDKQPFKRLHSVRVLAVSIIQMDAIEVDRAEIFKVLPHGWTKATVEAVLTHWHSLSPEHVQRFESGELGVAILPAVLKTPPEDRAQVIEELKGAATVAAATRKLNAKARLEAENDTSVDDSDVPDIEHDGLSRLPEDKPTAAAPQNNTRRESAKDTKPRVRVPVQATSPKTVRKGAERAFTKGKVTSAERAFFLGAKAALGDNNDANDILKGLDGLHDDARHAVAGVLYRFGVFGAAVHKIIKAPVLETIEAVTPKARSKSG